jgi:hypothetical protein
VNDLLRHTFNGGAPNVLCPLPRHGRAIERNERANILPRSDAGVGNAAYSMLALIGKLTLWLFLANVRSIPPPLAIRNRSSFRVTELTQRRAGLIHSWRTACKTWCRNELGSRGCQVDNAMSTRQPQSRVNLARSVTAPQIATFRSARPCRLGSPVSWTCGHRGRIVDHKKVLQPQRGNAPLISRPAYLWAFCSRSHFA